MFSTQVLDKDCKLNDPATWRITTLNRMMSEAAVANLVSAMGNLKEIEAKAELQTSAPTRRGLSFDSVMFTLLEHTGLAVQSHQLSLTEAFFKFDQGDAGLDEEERVRPASPLFFFPRKKRERP